MTDSQKADSKDKPMFTPGPWHRVDTWDCAKIMADGVATPVALVARGEDAALIAAAPDMYEALEQVKRLIDSVPHSVTSRAMERCVDAALRKARGQ